jgi:hypothetical protein
MSLKLINTTRRMRIGELGYVCALRFDTAYSKQIQEVEHWLTDRFGSKWDKDPVWYSMVGSQTYKDGYYVRRYYIGFKTKEMGTMVMLALS